MKKLLTFLMASILAIGVGWAETVTLSNANIVAAGDAADGYAEWTNLKDGGGNEWKAFAIKNQHSNATSQYHFLQIKKYASKVAYYIQVPELGFKITGITMTVSSTNKPMNGGSNSATLFFSGSNSTSAAGAGVASGTGASSVTIDCSSLNLNTGYITASGAVRIWDVVVTYENTVPSVSAPVISGTTPFEGSTQVSISCGTTGASIYYTTDGNAPTTSSTPYSAPFTITETTTVKAIAVLGNDVSGIVEKVFTKKTIVNVSSIADLNALQDGAEFKYTGTDLVALGQSGKNLFAQDANNGVLMFDNSESFNGQMYKLGDNIPAGFYGTKTTYNGTVEMTNLTGLETSESNVVPTPIEITISEVANNFGRYAVLRGVKVNTSSKTLSAGEESVAYYIYNSIFNGTLTDGSTYDITGICFKYNNKIQFLPIEAQELPDYTLIIKRFGNTGVPFWQSVNFTKVNDKMYVCRELYPGDDGVPFTEAGIEFKIMDKNGNRLGGQDGNSPYEVHKGWFRDLPLEADKEQNFKMRDAGNYNFIIKIDDNGIAKLFVPQVSDLYLKGSFGGWTDGDKFTRNEDGSFTLAEKEIKIESEFKIYDGNDAWYPGTPSSVSGDGTTITLKADDGTNCSIPAGKWKFEIDITKTIMVVTLIKEPHSITIDPNIENGTVTANKETATAGETVTLTVTPANGYELGTLTVMNGETPVEVAEDNTFIMPDAAVVVSATFVEKLEAMFNFDEDYATLFPTLEGGTSSSSSTAGDITEPLTATVDGVYLTVSPKTSGNINNRIWSASPRLRVYSGTITVEAPEGCILTQIDFTNHSSNFNLTPNTGKISGSEGTRTWTGEASTVIFTIVSNTQIKTMNVSYAEIPADQVLAPIIEGVTPFFPTTQVTMTCETVGAEIHYTLDGSEPTAESTLYESPITLSAQATVKAIAVKDGNISTIASKEFVMMTNVATIAEYKELAAGTEFGFTGNVTVTYVNGRYLYVKDETGSALIYGDTGTEFEFTQGQVLAPNWTAKTKNYNGLLEAETPANLFATNETVEVVPAEMQLNAISTENENEYIIVKNVAIGEPDNKNFTITDADENTITGRTNFTNVTHPTDFTVNYDITCVVAEYNGTVQLYPTDYKVHVDPVLLEGVVFAQGRNWATWYGDQDLALPEGVTAYIVTDISGDKATVEPLSYIPANVGVLLYSETADETVEAMPYEPDAPATVTGNLLVGVAQAQEVSNAYVLYNNEFVLIQDGTQVAAHRCYLQAGGNAAGAPRVLRIAAAGTVTGIDALVTDGNSGVKYYDLSGRYVGTSLNGKRGIFITSDGKKVVR